MTDTISLQKRTKIFLISNDCYVELCKKQSQQRTLQNDLPQENVLESYSVLFSIIQYLHDKLKLHSHKRSFIPGSTDYIYAQIKGFT